MASEHTPGPWAVGGTRDWPDVISIQTTDVSAVVVAEAYDEADARLIAAAPDLLAALTLWTDNGHDGHCYNCESEYTGEELDCSTNCQTVRAAIAKATDSDS